MTWSLRHAPSFQNFNIFNVAIPFLKYVCALHEEPAAKKEVRDPKKSPRHMRREWESIGGVFEDFQVCKRWLSRVVIVWIHTGCFSSATWPYLAFDGPPKHVLFIFLAKQDLSVATACPLELRKSWPSHSAWFRLYFTFIIKDSNGSKSDTETERLLALWCRSWKRVSFIEIHHSRGGGSVGPL
jgi:hypothetical protein